MGRRHYCLNQAVGMDQVTRTARLVAQSEFHRACLQTVALLNLPDYFIGAGFLRNLIWDDIHGFTSPSPLNDVDVVYHHRADITKEAEQKYEARLRHLMPGVVWQVRNQARMHVHKQHAPYCTTTEALSFWVETATCVGIRQAPDQTYCISAPLGLADNWAGRVRQNPAFDDTVVYKQRIEAKGWHQRWPKLDIQ
ncbi:nucleotidyltransferase family protein [Salinimonas marina]|uniref:Nucleotidyltransferase family protein n=1 Tax=Salinimonas marina TaxID=2785918 RepID=A0A7S9DZJ8_9ALTE|nr:nucleotidyltransferase family protein [Salinimonas marina]QPG06810.1 nucleotidyltransferase family protein [Salinimonas marina]